MVFEKISSLVAEQFGVDPSEVTMETSFKETLNADSLDLVELTMAVEDEFGIGEVADEELDKISTVGDLVSYIEKRLD